MIGEATTTFGGCFCREMLVSWVFEGIAVSKFKSSSDGLSDVFHDGFLPMSCSSLIGEDLRTWMLG